MADPPQTRPPIYQLTAMSDTITINGVEYVRADSVPAPGGGGTMTSQARAQRLVDEFEEGASFAGGLSIRHGIARVLRHVSDTDAQYGDEESFYAVPARTLEDLADALESTPNA